MLILTMWVAQCACTGVLAAARGRNWIGCMVLAVPLPVIVFIVVLLAGRRKNVVQEDAREMDMKALGKTEWERRAEREATGRKEARREMRARWATGVGLMCCALFVAGWEQELNRQEAARADKLAEEYRRAADRAAVAADAAVAAAAAETGRSAADDSRLACVRAAVDARRMADAGGVAKAWTAAAEAAEKMASERPDGGAA